MEKILDYMNRKQAKESLFIGIQKNSNQPIVKRESAFEEIEEYLYIRVDTVGDWIRILKVDTRVLEELELTEQEAWIIAQQNINEHTALAPMAKYLGEMALGMPIYVLTTVQRVRGAGAVTNQQILEEFADSFGVSQLLMLPASVHEVLIAPWTGERNLDEFSQMVREVNVAIEPKDVLADKAYIIDILGKGGKVWSTQKN